MQSSEGNNNQGGGGVEPYLTYEERENKFFNDVEVQFDARQKARAVSAYEKFHELPSGTGIIHQVARSSSGIQGWLDFASRYPVVDLPQNGIDEGKRECIVFIDLETSGLPTKDEKNPWKTPHYRDLTKYNGCRIIQMCAMLCDAKDLTPLETKSAFIKANDFDISEESYKTHGIFKEQTLEQGKEFAQCMQEDMYPLFSRASYVAAHNAAFDINVLKSELVRGNFVDMLGHMEKKMKVICTMKSTKHIVCATTPKGRIKNPTLKELYRFASGQEMEEGEHHDAIYDVINMHQAVKILVERDGLELYKKNNNKKATGNTTLKEEVHSLRTEIATLKEDAQKFKTAVLTQLSEIMMKLDRITM